MPVKVTDRSPQMLAAMDQAVRAALDAAATELRDAIKKRHYSANYYRGGAFRSTVQIVQSITKTMPERSPTGWSVQVGTKHMIALYWELGHRNRFLRRRVRVQLWKPTLIEKKAYLNALFGRTVLRLMQHFTRARA